MTPLFVRAVDPDDERWHRIGRHIGGKGLMHRIADALANPCLFRKFRDMRRIALLRQFHAGNACIQRAHGFYRGSKTGKHGQEGEQLAKHFVA